MKEKLKNKERDDIMRVHEVIRRDREKSRKEGIKEGIEKGEKRVLQLCQKLLEDGRNEELIRIAEDEKLREELYREYGL